MIVVCFIGLSLLLYPTVSNYWNQTFATHAISSYSETIENLDEADLQALREEAISYNKALQGWPNALSKPRNLKKEYEHCLNVMGDGMMGYIEIPKINVSLPIYHGTEDETLDSAVGHIDWSSLPVGGAGTHCVLSAHRGLPNAKLFTDLDRLREGDIFMLNVLKQTLTYEVDQILTVKPEDVEALSIVEGKDFCTLVTCTPYGINTHRLFVRGHRIENLGLDSRVVSEAVLIDRLIVALFLAIPILFLLVLAVMLKKPESTKPKNLELLLKEDE